MRLNILTKIMLLVMLLSLVPLAILSFLSVNYIDHMENTALEKVGDMQEIAVNDSLDSLNELGEIIIKNQAMAAKELIELYIKTHPEKTAADLINDKEFQRIGIQPVGEKGYTVVVLTQTQNMIAHPNTALMGKDLLESLQNNEKMQDWWRVVEPTWKNNVDSSGYYQWPEADGTYSDKYMYLAVIDTPLQGKNLSIAATTYTDEFNAPTKFLDEKLTTSKNNIVDEIRNTNRRIRHITLYAILVLFAAIIVLSMLFSNRLTKPISKLKDAADKVAQGDLSINANIKSNDEVGSLAASFDIMVDKLKESRAQLEKYSKTLEKKVKERTKELTKSNMKLKELDTEKTNFLNITSHELKTPLTVIYAYLDILDDSKNLSKEERRGFDIIRRNADQLKSLVTNILEVARIHAGRFELINSEINPKEKINEMMVNLQQLAKNKGIEIKADVKESTPEKMITDEQRFEEILNNLISNAIKFTEKGYVLVGSSGDKDFITVKIKDTGEGIPKNKMKNLFHDFYQVDSSISRKHGGTGLGLSITKKLIELQGGTIEVDSVKGEGTSFIFKLPINAGKKISKINMK